MKQWPSKDRYLALRSELESQSGEITQRVYDMARQKWSVIAVLPLDRQVLDDFKALRKRLRLR